MNRRRKFKKKSSFRKFVTAFVLLAILGCGGMVYELYSRVYQLNIVLPDNAEKYIYIPSNSEFSDVALNKIKLAIDDGTRKGLKILLHCSHGQRVASTLGAILYRDYGYTVEEAFGAANKAGMMSEWSVPRFYRLVERLDQMVPANVMSTEE